MTIENLTEQWKKGKLENDWYYIRTTNGIEKWEYIKQSHGFGYYETEWVLEVLAPVPSYVEWKNVTTCFDYEHKVYLSMVEENRKLKELLRGWREHLKDTKCDRCQNLIRKTGNAIGENNEKESNL